MKFKRETVVIEGGRKLYRYVFEEDSELELDEGEGERADTTAELDTGQEEPKGTSGEQGGR